jgi:hypothetical protein
MGGLLLLLHAHLRKRKEAGKILAKLAKIAPKSGKVFNNLNRFRKSDMETRFG